MVKDTLKPDEAAFDMIFQSLPVPMFLLDEDRRICKMTHVAKELLTKTIKETKESAFGNALKCIRSLDEPQGCGFGPFCKECPIRSTVADIFKTGKACYYKEVKLTVGEERRSCFLVISAMPIDLSCGRRVILYFEDITERRQTEEALKISRGHLNRAQEVAQLGSWYLDLTKNELLWSDGIYRIFGVPLGTAMTYEKFFEIVHPDDKVYVDKEWTAALKGKAYGIEHRIIVNGKMKWVREKAEVEFNEEGKAIRGIGTVQDITEHKQVEEDSRRLREELIHVTRVATMGELTAALAHELNQPLAAILSNAQAAQRFLAGKQPDLEEIREIISDIIKDDKRASEVIVKLRALLKKSKMQFSILNINEVILEVITFLRSDAVIKNISISTKFDDCLPLVHGDRIQLQQVILNLILNSFDAMTSVDLKGLCIRTAKESQEAITVSLEDTGIGIDEKNIDRLFKPFFTTKKEGLGMGLAINKAIIEAHGGKIRAKNNPERGAIFYFTLPVCKELPK